MNGINTYAEVLKLVETFTQRVTEMNPAVKLDPEVLAQQIPSAVVIVLPAFFFITCPPIPTPMITAAMQTAAIRIFLCARSFRLLFFNFFMLILFSSLIFNFILTFK